MLFSSAHYDTHVIQPIISYIEDKGVYRYTIILESQDNLQDQVFLFNTNPEKGYSLGEVELKLRCLQESIGFDMAPDIRFVIGLDDDIENDEEENVDVHLIEYRKFFNLDPIKPELTKLNSIVTAYWELDEKGRYIGYTDEPSIDQLIDLHQTRICLTLFDGNENILIETKELEDVKK